MPAPVVDGLLTFLAARLDASVWDGEVPRYDAAAEPIKPASAVTPINWPVVKAVMSGGFSREWTLEDPYTDSGQVTIQIYGTTRVQTEAMMDDVEALLAKSSNWPSIVLGGDPSNPYYVISCMLVSWLSVQEEGWRTQLGELLYRCDLHYSMVIHGAIQTR